MPIYFKGQWKDLHSTSMFYPTRCSAQGKLWLLPQVLLDPVGTKSTQCLAPSQQSVNGASIS